jgi:hypothetical protein
LFPAVTVVPEGVAANEKSAKNNVNASVADCWPLLPVIEKFNGFAEVDLRPVIVRVLDCPPEIEEGLNVQVAALLQESAMGVRNVLGAAAETVKVAVWDPMSSTLDRALEESEKTGVPVPVKLSEVAPVTAFEVIWTVPVVLPVVVGEKLTAMVQAWPTFNTAGVVGKFPHVLVWPNPPEDRMLEMVTA